VDRDDHRQTLLRVERELDQLLDDTAGMIGPAITTYRVALWDARANVKAASAQLGRLPS
jgi:hypothetical protein